MILDNRANGKVISELKKVIQPTSKLSFLSGFFSIYGFYALKKELSNLDEFRLMLSCWDEDSLNAIAGTFQEIALKNKLNQSHVAKECVNWFNKNVLARAMNEKRGFSTYNMFHVNNKDNFFVVTGGSHFTATGLGEIKSDSFEMNNAISNVEEAKKHLQWFDDIWNNARATKDIKNELMNYLNYLAEDKPANLIYFITLYNLFKDSQETINEDSIIRSKTGIKDTIIWKKLYKFQRDGVIGAIDKLEKYNGCIIADSVGLGKTFEALAIIKYYELRNDRVLVLCPKKLRENWVVYKHNDTRNLLLSDRFNYDVLNHTDLSRSGGTSGEINLETLNWANYDLLVIDESHNFRNSGTKSGGATRYQKLMKDIIQSGVKTKVLMLSATPVNSRMNDLKNQIAFITEGQDSIYSDFGINSINNTLKKAQTNFNEWLKVPSNERKTETLLENMNFDYFKLLDLLTIARSRKHIEKYYDIKEIGKFPNRLKPMNIKANIDISGQFPPLEGVNKSIKSLKLAIYAPLTYVRMEKKEEYSRKYDQEVKGGGVFRQVDRENSLTYLMRINLLKRMESSINSFAQTVGTIRNKIQTILDQITRYEMNQHENSEFESLSIEDIQIDDEMLEDYLIGNKKTKILIQDMDLIFWRQDLEHDLSILKELQNYALAVTSKEDAKLIKLKEILENKIHNPINRGNKKFIIFTAFADTATYLYENIAEWALLELGLNSSLVTGTGASQCTIKGLKKDLNTILTHFSPISKERDKIYPNVATDIDILIATDCISEGQNLQDCDMLINYDIHWNPVRIIQRFGRIDRLGSKNEAIQLTNFWPNMELDEYINLESRVSGRLVLLDISATGEENLIDHDEKKPMNDLDYRRQQLKQLQESVINLEDMEGTVSITDMTLNDFRMDLSDFMKTNDQKLKQSTSGFYAVVNKAMDEIVSGTIFCLKDRHQKVDFDPNYTFAPYCMVYVAEDGTVVYNHLQTKKILDIFKKLSSMNKVIDESAIASLNHVTNKGKDMSAYQFMLEKAIQSVIGKAEEKGIESLFRKGGTALTKDQFSGIEDFEVMSYLIIREVVA